MRTKILGHIKIVIKYLRFLIVGINQDRGRERERDNPVFPQAPGFAYMQPPGAS